MAQLEVLKEKEVYITAQVDDTQAQISRIKMLSDSDDGEKEKENCCTCAEASVSSFSITDHLHLSKYC